MKANNSINSNFLNQSIKLTLSDNAASHFDVCSMWFTSVNETTVNAIHLIASIIQQVYPQLRCVYYLGLRTELLDQVFYELGMPVVFIPSMCIPTGYLLAEDETFENFRHYNFYTKRNLRLLIVNQRADYNFQQRCKHYKSFDHEVGLHVYLLHIRISNNNIIGLDFYAIRDCAKLSQDELENRLKVRTTRWRPSPEQTIHVSATQFMPFIDCDENRLIGGIETFIFHMALPNVNYALQCYSFGKWTQVEEDVAAQRADIGFGGAWDIKGIQIGVDFAAPLFQTCATMLVPKPKLLPIQTFSFQALNLDMWLAIIFVIILVTIIHKWLEKLPFFQAFMEVYKTIVDAPSHKLTRIPSKIMYVTWLMTCVLITTAMSAGFTMILTRPRFTTPITTFKDVYDHGLECYEPENYVSDIMNSSNDKYLRLIGNRIKFTTEGITRDHTCLFCDVLPNEYVIPSTELDDYSMENLMILPNCYGEYKFVSYFKENSPLKRLFNAVINQAREHGLISGRMRYIKANDVHSSKQTDMFKSKYAFDVDESSKSLELDEAQGALYALCIGNFLGLLVFMGELAYYQYYDNRILFYRP